MDAKRIDQNSDVLPQVADEPAALRAMDADRQALEIRRMLAKANPEGYL